MLEDLAAHAKQNPRPDLIPHRPLVPFHPSLHAPVAAAPSAMPARSSDGVTTVDARRQAMTPEAEQMKSLMPN
jgi:hypothetical protein